MPILLSLFFGSVDVLLRRISIGYAVTSFLCNFHIFFLVDLQNCTNKFDSVAEDPRFRFFGNVNVGGPTAHAIPHNIQLPLASILSNYTHLLFATGCTLPRLHPALPPSEYCVPALNLVHWYTDHPSRPTPPQLDKVSHIALIGHGNVSLDISRMLLSDPSSLLTYDIPESVLRVLFCSSVKHISILGRRGPFEVSFTTKELREMMNLPDASMVPIDSKLLTPPPDVSLSRQQSRILQILQKGSKNTYGTTPKTWSIDFFRSPTGLTPPSSSTSLAELTLAHTTLDPKTRRAVPSSVTSKLPTSLVVTSLGFHAENTSPFYDPTMGHLRTISNRIVSASGATLKNIYASGWAATGAKGVLASTMMNAYAVADTIISDISPNGEAVNSSMPSYAGSGGEVDEVVMNPDPPHPEDPPPEIQVAVKDRLVMGYDAWEAVDDEEVRIGRMLGKGKERMRWEDARLFLSTGSSNIRS
jgi:adrenodoxin-NADP+ reductase